MIENSVENDISAINEPDNLMKLKLQLEQQLPEPKQS